MQGLFAGEACSMTEEKEIWLSYREIKQLLDGSLSWEDISHRVTSLQQGSKGAFESQPDLPEQFAMPQPDAVEPFRSHKVAKNNGLAGMPQTSIPSGRDVQPTEVEFPVGEEEARPGRLKLEGRPVLGLLAGVGAVTVILWLYYVIRT